MDGVLEFIRGRGWSSLAIAIGFVGVTTLLLIPRTKPQRRHDPNTGRRESERTSA